MNDSKITRLVPRAADDEREENVDGRRLRSERSRQQIVAAMFEVVSAGDMDPSAATVAEAAGVSLRTVFRHFEEMDSLYREMTAELEAEIMPIVMTPFKASDWHGRLLELVKRRAGIYERLLPFKVASSARRFQSEFLMDDYRRFLNIERAGLKGILPETIQSDAMLFAALEMVTGFQAWQRMRQDQNLRPEEAEEVMRMTALRLVEER